MQMVLCFSKIHDENMSVEVISWLILLPKNKPLCQLKSSFLFRGLQKFTIQNSYNCEWTLGKKKNCLWNERIYFFFAGSPLLLLFHDNSMLREVWLSAAVSGNVQVIPMGTVIVWAQFSSHLFLHWSIWQTLLLLFGKMYWCSLTATKNTNEMIVKLNLVLIDVLCIVSFTVYGSKCVMWDCTYVFVSCWFVYCQLCLDLSLQVCTSDVLVNVNLFIFFLNRFLQKHEHHRAQIF